MGVVMKRAQFLSLQGKAPVVSDLDILLKIDSDYARYTLQDNQKRFPTSLQCEFSFE